MDQSDHSIDNQAAEVNKPLTQPPVTLIPLVPEIGGRDGPDPTRYGDWEKNGRCIDF
jgi:hypothetical protein